MLAETQQQIALQQKRSVPPQDRGRVLEAIKLQDFDGHPNTLVRVYREWRKSVTAVQIFHNLTVRELALVLFSTLKGRTKMRIELLTLEDVEGENGLSLIWGCLTSRSRTLRSLSHVGVCAPATWASDRGLVCEGAALPLGVAGAGQYPHQ